MNDEVSKRLFELSEHLDESEAPESSEIKAAVDSFAADGDHDALQERFQGWLLRFESSHPQMSRIVARVLDAMPGV